MSTRRLRQGGPQAAMSGDAAARCAADHDRDETPARASRETVMVRGEQCASYMRGVAPQWMSVDPACHVPSRPWVGLSGLSRRGLRRPGRAPIWRRRRLGKDASAQPQRMRRGHHAERNPKAYVFTPQQQEPDDHVGGRDQPQPPVVESDRGVGERNGVPGSRTTAPGSAPREPEGFRRLCRFR